MMVGILGALGGFIVWPIILIGINSFNTTNTILADPDYGLANWKTAFSQPDLIVALGNTLMIFFASLAIEFPVAVLIAWALARVKIPFSQTLEFLFWIAFLLPSISVTMGWMFMLDPFLGFLNKVAVGLPFIDSAPFNIFSVPGIIFVHVMGGGISGAIILLTPAFRNMSVVLEEAAWTSGASNFRTFVRVTLPLLIPPMVVVLAVRLARMFQSFEVEQLLGNPFGFFVYSTKIYALTRADVPQYGQATALASIVLLLVVFIIPTQRWLMTRRSYTTVTGSFKPGRIDLGFGNNIILAGLVLLLLFLIAAPLGSLILGSFMTRTGLFFLDPLFTTRHWELVLKDRIFIEALKNTLLLGAVGAIFSPLLFSFFAYIIVRTRWFGRSTLDGTIWLAAAIPGILSGLGLLWMLLGTPFLRPLYGTLVPLMIVTVISGKTTGVQLSKAVFLQMGQDMEEQARVSGAGWLRTYVRIWLPLMAPTLVLLSMINFMLAVNATASLILIAPRGTNTLSLLALEFAEVGSRTGAGIVSLIIMVLSVGMALAVKVLGVKMRR